MTPIEQIKEKIDIVKFIGSYIEVKPAGKNFKANCPFHGEKTPSFMISSERQTWHCFGACQEGGDIFKFLMKYDNIEFYEALKILAEKAGIELKKISPIDQKEFGVLYDINESAKNFYKEWLGKSQIAKKYLSDRGLKQETIDEFEIGFAPNDFEDLTIYLINIGYDIKDIERSGVSFKSEKGKYLNRFRGRLMFPIYNHVGKIAGFSGRIMPQFDNGESGKYINSPETPIFNKSKILYGFSKTKNEIHRSNSAILVEGQMDFLMCWQEGIKNVIATSGTAFTNEHLKAIKNQTDTLIFSFDNDEAGIKAAERSIDLANSMDFNTKVLMFKGVKDPAEAVQKDVNIMKTAIEEAMPAMEFYFDVYLRDALKDPSQISTLKKSIRKVLEKVKILSSAIERAHWILRLSSKTKINEEALRKEMEDIKSDEPFRPPSKNDGESKAVKNEVPTRRELICDRLLKIAIVKNEFYSQIKEGLEYFPQNFKIAFDVLVEKKPLENARLKSAIDSFGLEASMIGDKMDDEKIGAEVTELLKRLKKEFLTERQNDLSKKIKEAENAGNKNELSALLQEFDETLKLIHN